MPSRLRASYTTDCLYVTVGRSAQNKNLAGSRWEQQNFVGIKNIKRPVCIGKSERTIK